MQVYKFLPANWAIDDLKERRIKASDPDTLNDPFEFFAVDLTDRIFREDFQQRVESVLNNKVLCCFSSQATNPLLWAHYSDCHKGICLGFKLPESIADKLRIVDYVGERKRPDQVRNNCDVRDLLFTKFSAWSYEKEVRAFLPRDLTTPKDQPTYVPFDSDLRLTEVVLGCKCETNVSEVKSMLKHHEAEVSIFRAVPSMSVFEICLEEI